VKRRRRPAFAELVTAGPGLHVRGEPRLELGGEIIIGSDVTIAARPAITHLATGPGGRLLVGDRVRIGHGTAIAALKEVVIGDDSTLGPFVMIMDSDFHVAGGGDDAEPTPIRIGRRVRIGPGTVLLPGADVGDGARIAGGSVVGGPVPAGAEVAGNPAIERSTVGPWVATTAEVVAAVLGMAEPPDRDVRPADVATWDSLGALRLLLELERVFGVRLDDAAVLAARSVGDLETLVESAARR
jgi:acetyltransferase-like isoleucine patch superfamily enzyme/acyl carrier protein